MLPASVLPSEAGGAGGGKRGEQQARLRGSDHQLGRVDFVAGVGGEKVFERKQQRLAFGLRGGDGGGDVGKAGGRPGLVPVFAEVIGQHATGRTDEGLAIGIGHDDGGAEIGLGAQGVLVIGLRGDGGGQVGAHARFEVLFEADGGLVVVAAVGHVFGQGEDIIQRIGESV